MSKVSIFKAKLPFIVIISLMLSAAFALLLAAILAFFISPEIYLVIVKALLVISFIIPIRIIIRKYKKLAQYINHGGQTTAKISEVNINNDYSSEGFAVKKHYVSAWIKYSYIVDGRNYEVKHIISDTDRSFRNISEMKVYYDPQYPEKHMLETKRDYISVDHKIFDSIGEAVKKKYEEKSAAFLSGRISEKEFLKLKGKITRVSMLVFAVLVPLILLTGIVAGYFQKNNIEHKWACAAAFLFILIVGIITGAVSYKWFRKFLNKNNRIYGLLINGKCTKAKLTDTGGGSKGFIVNNTPETEIAYEFTDSKGLLHNKTESVNLLEILKYLKCGDEIDICYNPENPEECYWVMG